MSNADELYGVLLTTPIDPKKFGGGEGGSGADGITPHIGANGNWFVGDTDMGVKAKGEDGKDGYSIVGFGFPEDNYDDDGNLVSTDYTVMIETADGYREEYITVHHGKNGGGNENSTIKYLESDPVTDGIPKENNILIWDLETGLYLLKGDFFDHCNSDGYVGGYCHSFDQPTLVQIAKYENDLYMQYYEARYSRWGISHIFKTENGLDSTLEYFSNASIAGKIGVAPEYPYNETWIENLPPTPNLLYWLDNGYLIIKNQYQEGYSRIHTADTSYSKPETDAAIAAAVENIQPPTPDLSGYVTDAELENALANIPTGGGGDTTEVLYDFTTEEEVQQIDLPLTKEIASKLDNAYEIMCEVIVKKPTADDATVSKTVNVSIYDTKNTYSPYWYFNGVASPTSNITWTQEGHGYSILRHGELTSIRTQWATIKNVSNTDSYNITGQYWNPPVCKPIIANSYDKMVLRMASGIPMGVGTRLIVSVRGQK